MRQIEFFNYKLVNLHIIIKMVSVSGAPSTISRKELALFNEASDSEFAFRRLEWGDFDKGFLEALKGLTKVGDTTKT